MQILGSDIENIMRLQFARMPPGGVIKTHVDMGGYSATGHRIHVVIDSNPDVKFLVCQEEECIPIHVDEGLVFELHNRLHHSVENGGTRHRIHLVVDVAESKRVRRHLKVGQVCDYTGGVIVCDASDA